MRLGAGREGGKLSPSLLSSLVFFPVSISPALYERGKYGALPVQPLGFAVVIRNKPSFSPFLLLGGELVVPNCPQPHILDPPSRSARGMLTGCLGDAQGMLSASSLACWAPHLHAHPVPAVPCTPCPTCCVPSVADAQAHCLCYASIQDPEEQRANPWVHLDQCRIAGAAWPRGMAPGTLHPASGINFLMVGLSSASLAGRGTFIFLPGHQEEREQPENGM